MIEISEQLQNIFLKIENYPRSLKGSIFEYNLQDLFEVLGKKEEKELLPDDSLRKETLILSTRYGNIAEEINSNYRGEKNIEVFKNIYNSMLSLDKEISETLFGLYKLYALQWGLSVKALWYYRNNDFDTSIDLTLSCIDNIDKLIEKGMYCLIFRNIEQNKNLSFVSRTKKQIVSSELISSGIIQYYFLGSTKYLIGTCFKNYHLWNEMPYVRESYGYIYFREQVEVYYNLLKINTERAKSFFMYVFKNLVDCKVDTMERFIMIEWIKTQEKYYRHEYVSFLIETDIFLDDSKKEFYDVFKKVLIHQLIGIVNIDKWNIDTKYFLKLIDNYSKNKLSQIDVIDINGGTRKAKIE